MQSHDTLQVVVEPVNQIVLPNEIPIEEKSSDTLPLPTKPKITEQRPAVAESEENKILKQTDTDRQNARHSTKGLFGKFSSVKMLSTNPDISAAENQQAWEQFQNDDVKRRASIKEAVSPIKGQESPPLLDRVQSITRSRALQKEKERPEFVEPLPVRRPSQTHSRKSSQAFIAQSIPARTVVDSPETASPVLSPVVNMTSFSGAASSTELKSPQSNFNPPHSPYPGKTTYGFPSLGPNKETKPNQANNNSGICCVIL